MSSSGLESLYQQLILDHSRHPEGFGLLPDPAGSSHQVNPTCGDEITLQVHLGAGGEVAELRWEGQGCAISRASASLLAGLAPGLTLDALAERIEAFRTAMRSRGSIEPDPELLGDAAALGGVSRYIARVKCAMLAWVALEDAAAQARGPG